MKLSLVIDNTYDDGYSTTTRITIDAPPPGDDLDEWASDVIFPHTGVGHDGAAIYEARIVACDSPQLVGKTFTWDG